MDAGPSNSDWDWVAADGDVWLPIDPVPATFPSSYSGTVELDDQGSVTGGTFAVTGLIGFHMEINGNSAMFAKPLVSVVRSIAGPDVAVHAKFPVKDAPIAELIPAISSSAWNVFTPKFR